MDKEAKMKNPITAFTSDGDVFAVLSSATTVKIWSTKNGSLLTEWKPIDGDSSDISFTSMACSFVGKKRRKERGTCLLALGMDNGNVFTVDVFSGETKWTTDSFPCEVSGLSFTNKGRNLCVVGNNGMVYKMNSEDGRVLENFKASKNSIKTLAFSCDEKFLAVTDGRLRVLSLETSNEFSKFSSNSSHVQYASMSDRAETLVTLGSGDKHLQVWKLDKKDGKPSRGPTLSMKHAPLSFQCKEASDGDSGTAILAISKSGAYVWHLRTQLEVDEVSPTKITCKVYEEDENRSRVSIIAAKLLELVEDGNIRALVTYGSIDQPRFTLVHVSNPGDGVVINASEETKTIPDSGVTGKDLHDLELEATISPKKGKKANKKRATSDLDQTTPGETVNAGNGEAVDGVLVDDDFDEPTMGEKIADLNIVDGDIAKSNENDSASLAAKPPSADSVHVLLKQALHADDRVLLLDCLYTQDEKVIAKSISQLSPSHVLKLLQSLMSLTQSRGAILACALPWLKCLLLQHSSGIMSQQSSLVALNSLYQLIESRVSTFQSALQLSSVLDVLYTGIVDDEVNESGTIEPAIFEDKDSSEEEEESEDEAMETDEDNNNGEAVNEALGGLSDLEGMTE